MQHLPRHVRPRALARVRGAGVAGLMTLMVLLAACKGAESAAAAPAADAGAAASAGVQPPAIPSANPPAAGSADELAAVRAQLDATLNQAAACSTDAECRTVAVGAKACGGPTRYRAYSARGADPKTVADLAQHERDLSMIEARESGRVSACFTLADPGAHCLRNKCVTGAAGTH